MSMGQKKLERMTMPRSNRPRKSKRVAVSSKRQISIPKEFYEQLNIGEEVIIELYGSHLVLRPFRESFDDFSNEILEELIAEGYRDAELLAEFKNRKAQISSAAKSLIVETMIHGKKTTVDDLFGVEDEI